MVYLFSSFTPHHMHSGGPYHMHSGMPYHMHSLAMAPTPTATVPWALCTKPLRSGVFIASFGHV